ncbi:MAG: CoA transferase [Rhodospirillaceae bacterium]|nr:CoA transferase [Rhodospirillaceae bacterium]|tara:strand:- start:1821 stop:3017 length:1197 start_codon:yes stop_codon:yes gene_type:complete
MLPLSDVQILAVEQYGAGPCGTQYLADLGAEVIKIENPHDGGDMSRSVGPYFLGNGKSTASSEFFQSFNRNKKSITLDISKRAGKAVFHDLVRSADALCCNMRGDVPAKLGLTYETLGEINPKIVCAFLTAYGRDGSRKDWPGFDYLMQAEAGYFSLTGEPDTLPSRMGLSLVDIMTGQTMALSCCAAIIRARETGQGQNIDTNLFDLAMSNLGYLGTWYLNERCIQGREARSGHPSLVPCAQFSTKDGWIFLMCNKEKFWPILCDKIGRPELGSDPRYANFKERLENRRDIQTLLDETLAAKTTSEWLEIFAGIVPAAPILNLGEAIENPFIKERDRVMDLTLQDGTPFRLLDAPFETGTPTPTNPAPELGANTDEILTKLGYDEDRLRSLRENKTI